MIGVNYYHESMGYITRSVSQIEFDMEQIAKKFKAIKIYHNPFKPDSLAVISSIIEIAKSKGLYIVWVENNDNTQLTESNWAEYSLAVQNDCVVADRLGVNEFLVGNEISIHNDDSEGFNDTNLPLKIKHLVKGCQRLSKMLISYQEGWWKKDAWYNSKLENLLKIHFTLYENLADFESYARDIRQKFGNSAVIGEWSTQSTMALSAQNERDWAEQLTQRRLILNREGLDHYIFCFRDTGVDSNDKGFGLWKNTIDQPHLIWYLFYSSISLG